MPSNDEMCSNLFNHARPITIQINAHISTGLHLIWPHLTPFDPSSIGVIEVIELVATLVIYIELNGNCK